MADRGSATWPNRLHNFLCDWPLPQAVRIEQVLHLNLEERIAIKATFVRNNELPFDNRDRPASVMSIEAIGTITANSDAGQGVSVA